MSPVQVLWQSAPGGLRLVDGETIVFCALLDVPLQRLAELTQSLSEDERQRAVRFRLERDRQRFQAGRGTLREILGVLLNLPPAKVVFSYGKFGKPQIAAPAAGPCLHFNLAHSDSLAVYAVARFEVGVDLERIRALDDALQIADRFFSPREKSCLLALPEQQRLEAFFNGWTRKEAYLKAVGSGLDDCVSQIEVSLRPTEPAELLRVPHDSPPWFLHALTPAASFVGALALPKPDICMNCWKWSEPP